jgi:hypothetical protein
VAKIGEDALANMARQGLNELRAANAGTPVIENAAPEKTASESPTVETPSYESMIEQRSSMAELPVQSQEQEISR